MIRLVVLSFPVALVACSSSSATEDLALQCMFEVDPEGSYAYPAGVRAPLVVPVPGGTQAGADAINACIRQKAAA